MTEFTIYDIKVTRNTHQNDIVYGRDFYHTNVDKDRVEITLLADFFTENKPNDLIKWHKEYERVTLISSKHMKLLKKFKNEFIQYLEDKHPEKLIKEPEAWELIHTL